MTTHIYRYDIAYCPTTEQDERINFWGDVGFCNACGETDH